MVEEMAHLSCIHTHMYNFHMCVDSVKTHKSKRQLVTRSFPYFQKIVSHSPVVENAHLIFMSFDFHVFKTGFVCTEQKKEILLLELKAAIVII